MPVRNMDLKTKSKTFKLNASATNIGGQVPAGMKRWVTFLMIDTNQKGDASDCVVNFASLPLSNPTKASIVAVANRKLRVAWVASDLSICNCGGLPYQIPSGGPDPDNPLFSIAAENFLAVFTSLGATANVFMQYFDE